MTYRPIRLANHGNLYGTLDPRLALAPIARRAVVAARWLQAYDAGVAAPVVLAATSERALDVVPLEVLRSLSVDVPPDLSAWE